MEGLKVKHTPGPWEVRGFAVFGDGYELANCVGSFKPIHENLANAQLIASAPELLEACKAYADKYFSRAKGDLERLTPEARQILNAIAKAEGRA